MAECSFSMEDTFSLGLDENLPIENQERKLSNLEENRSMVPRHILFSYFREREREENENILEKITPGYD